MKAIAPAFLVLAAIAGTTTAVVSADVAQKAKADAEAATGGPGPAADHGPAPATAGAEQGFVGNAWSTGKDAEQAAAARVSHSFASVDMGRVGILRVGSPTGSGGH